MNAPKKHALGTLEELREKTSSPFIQSLGPVGGAGFLISKAMGVRKARNLMEQQHHRGGLFGRQDLRRPTPYISPDSVVEAPTATNRLGFSTQLRKGILSDARIQEHRDMRVVGPQTSNAVLRVLETIR